jgi:hypothetical protein
MIIGWSETSVEAGRVQWAESESEGLIQDLIAVCVSVSGYLTLD